MTAEEARAPFAKALRAAMRRRGVGTAALAREVGMSISRVSDARQGRTMPVARNVAAIAHALDAPGLVELAQAALTMSCDECGRSFVRHARKRDARFCEAICRTRWHNRADQRREAGERPDLVRSLSRQNTYLRGLIATLRDERAGADAAVAAFCHSCEWDGICKTPPCEIRELSPLPLAEGLREAVA